MSKSIRNIAVVGIVLLASACARQAQVEEFVVVEPISSEPVYTGKYK